MMLSYWLSRRFKLKGDNPTGAAIAVAGVALAIIVLEITLAVAVGFKQEIRRKLMGFDAQVTVLPPYDSATGTSQNLLNITPELISGIREALPYNNLEIRLAVRQPGILKTDGDFQGVIIHGQRVVDGKSTEAFSFEKGNIVEGIWPDFEADSMRNAIVISQILADKLGLDVGDKVYSSFFVNDNVKVRRHEIAGIYRSNFSEYDNVVAYASLGLLQSVAGTDSTAGMRLDIRRLPEEADINEAAANIFNGLMEKTAAGKLDGLYPVSSVVSSDAIYFNWLSLLDTNVAVIFILMLCVSGFTLVSSLFILVLERIRDIGILRALGAGRPLVANTFIWLALRLVGRGMIIGNVVGLGLIMIQKFTGVVPLNPEMYYLPTVPVNINIATILLLNLGVVLTAWLILVLPARLATRIDPSRTMQYE